MGAFVRRNWSEVGIFDVGIGICGVFHVRAGREVGKRLFVAGLEVSDVGVGVFDVRI